MRTRILQASVALAAVAGLLAASIFSQSRAQSVYLGQVGMPYAAFDELPKTELDVGGAVIRVAFAPGQISLPKEDVFDWIKASAKAVSTYYGKFPVQSVRLLIVPVDGPRVQGGTTWGYRGAAIRIRYGRTSDKDDLKRDWVLVHEMVHLALPDVADRYSWLSEGLAVYIEPIARVQSGDLTAKQIWGAMIRDMPNGLPRFGDQGLDNTSTWGRKYWGGAMYCLLADVEIRKRTNNRLGLQDAMRGLLASGANHEVNWPVARILANADKSVGLDVLERLHDEMGSKPVSPPLEALWRDLGVSLRDGNVYMDDNAPLAGIRQAMTRPAT